MKDNPMQSTQTTPPLSRLDYIATQIYAAWNVRPGQDLYPADAIALAKNLIQLLDKEQTP